MAKMTEMKVELVLETGNLVDALKVLSEGLESHGVKLTPDASEFFADWIRSNAVTSVGAKISELSRRLSQYECVYHESPVDGCDDCEKLQVDEEWKNLKL